MNVITNHLASETNRVRQNKNPLIERKKVANGLIDLTKLSNIFWLEQNKDCLL